MARPDGPAPDRRGDRPGNRPRPRKPTPAERREQRGTVEDPAEVLDAAARFLEARPRSVDEVRRKLGRLGYQAQLVEATVARLLELGYLDDDAFARSWVESRDRARPRGEHALRRELELKGVDRALVDGVLEGRRGSAPFAGAAEVTGRAAEVTGRAAGMAGAGDEEPTNPDDAAAERLLRRKLSALQREPDPRRRRQRAYATLARSGFSPDVCSSVSRRVLDAAAVGGPDGGDDPGDDLGEGDT